MSLTAWASFFSAELDSCATFAGLLVVAISINLTKILETQHLPGRAGESLFSLAAAFTLCSAALTPDIAAPALGWLALVLAAASLAFGARNQVLWTRSGDRLELPRLLIGGGGRLASTVPTAVGGVLMLAHAPQAVTWIAWGIVAALVASILNAWVLLVEIIR